MGGGATETLLDGVGVTTDGSTIQSNTKTVSIDISSYSKLKLEIYLIENGVPRYGYGSVTYDLRHFNFSSDGDLYLFGWIDDTHHLSGNIRINGTTLKRLQINAKYSTYSFNFNLSVYGIK